MDAKRYERLANDQWNEVYTYIPYWNALDEHIISRCPFTGELHTQLLDTYNADGNTDYIILTSVRCDFTINCDYLNYSIAQYAVQC